MNTGNDYWTNSITHCLRCGSTILWDEHSRPKILKLWNDAVLTCLQVTCNVLSMSIPSPCCRREELDVIRLGLQSIGLSEEDARRTAMMLGKKVAAA